MRVALVLAVLVGGSAHADELANSPNRAGYEPTGRLFDFAARRHLDVDHGIDPMLTYVSEVFVAPQLNDRVVSAGLLMLELDLALDKLIGPGWGAAYVAGVAIHGKALTDELMDIHGTSGNAAPAAIRLFEAWVEQPLGPLTLRAGLLAADQEFVLAEHASTLLSATFGITSQFSANLVGPVYPIGAPGVSARAEIAPKIVSRLAIYDGSQRNTHGIPQDLGPASLVLGEVAIDTVSIGAWHHSEHGDGIYAIGDIAATQHVGAFARVGYSDGPVPHYIDAGLRITPGHYRPDDLASIGIAYASTETGPQILVEAAYEIQIRWLTLQPDLQLQMLRDRMVEIVALRGTVVF